MYTMTVLYKLSNIKRLHFSKCVDVKFAYTKATSYFFIMQTIILRCIGLVFSIYGERL